MQTFDDDQTTAERTLKLTTVDAATGKERTVALAFVRDGTGARVAAAPEADWHRDLLDRPMVSVAIDGAAFGAIAVPAEDGATVRLERSEPEADAALPAATDFAGKLLEIHTWLRSQLRHVRSEAAAHFAARAAHDGPDAAPGPGLGLQLRQHCLAFCQSLEFHHTGEEHMFPGIEGRHPHLRDAIERLRSEHRTVARIQGELVALLADIASADADAFTAELDRMTAELTAHLDYEEASLFPVLAEIPFPPPGA
ncbi:MAG TPA: nitroreductase/quinone reductase family protein [Glycomyces sp.]|nr:nitroreductase/quinone reductase family protein [Glycomyces sp.]